MTSKPPPLSKILRADESVLWSYFLTDERLAKETENGKLSSIILILFFGGLMIFMAIRLPAIGLTESQNDNWSAFDAAALVLAKGVGVLMIACLGWLVWRVVKHFPKAPPNSDRRYMLATNQRLLVTNLKGRILDEMSKAEIEFVVDQHKSGDFLVTRVGDSEGTRSFFMPMIDDYKAAARAVRDLRLGG